MRHCSAADYLDNWQTKENFVLEQEQSICYPFARISQKGNLLEKPVFIEKNNKSEMENPQRRECSVCFILQ